MVKIASPKASATWLQIFQTAKPQKCRDRVKENVVDTSFDKGKAEIARQMKKEEIENPRWSILKKPHQTRKRKPGSLSPETEIWTSPPTPDAKCAHRALFFSIFAPP